MFRTTVLGSTVLGAATTLALLAPAAPATALPDDVARASSKITGTWKGGVHGDDGGPAGYTAKVKIFKKDGKLRGKITYPEYCSGKWVLKGKSDGWTKFREKITKDPGPATCVTPVNVKVKRDKARLKVVWVEPQTGDRGTMRAKKV